MNPKIDPAAREILRHYPAEIAESRWRALGSGGGFSGARIWRGDADSGRSYCLRAWPTGRTTVERLEIIHTAQDRCPLPITPKVARTRDGKSYLQRGEQFWEVSDWMPGHADFHTNPTDTKLLAAMDALASIHVCWRPSSPREIPCPAVGRIRAAFANWRKLLQSGFKLDYRLPHPPEIHERARRAWNALLGGTFAAEHSLIEWLDRPVPVQLCFCDVWHDHILYEGNEVTAIIDFGAVKLDCVAIDLARLLGSLIPDEPERMKRALAVWSAQMQVPQIVVDLVPVLDQVGKIVGLTNWLRWLYLDDRPVSDPGQVLRRMDALLRRVENKKPTGLFPWA